MARFNSSLISNTITGTTSVGSPFNGSFTQLTGTAPYTVTLASPTLFPGINQQFYNATSGTITLSTPAGNFVGAGGSAASTFPVYAGNVVSITADGTNYIVISEDGSALTATSATISGVLTVQSSGGVAIAPSTTGTIDNVNVGATTRGSGAFNTLTANNAVTFTANTASATTATGTVVITGGLGVSGTINAASVSASLTGTIQTAAQPNITSTGSLTIPGLVVGHTATIGTQNYTGFALASTLHQIHGATQNTSTAGIFNWSSSASSGGNLIFNKSLSNVVGTRGALTAANTDVGVVSFNGDDGTDFIPAASILAETDGIPGVNDMPGRLVFGTTADGALATTERMRIDSAGRLRQFGTTIISNVDVLNATYDNVLFSVAAQETTPTGVFFSPDGYKMFVCGSAGDDVNEYVLSTPWVVSSATFSTNFALGQGETSTQDLFFRADGLKMYIAGNTLDGVLQYALASPWSVATAIYESKFFSTATQELTPTSVFFKPDGVSMYVTGTASDGIYQYTLSVPWDVTTATHLQTLSTAGQDSNAQSISFTGDGTRLFMMGSTGDDINVYNLTTPWNISTASFVNVFSVALQETAPVGLYVKPDGTKMYVVGSTGTVALPDDAVYQYSIPSVEIELTGTTDVNGSLTVAQDFTVNGRATVNGNVGIGTTNPTETLHVSGTNIRIDGTSGEAGVYMYRSNNNAPDVRFYSSSGSIASPTAKPNGGLVGQIHWHGHDGTGYQDRAGIYGTVDGAVSTGTVPIALRFLTGTSSLVETMRITSAGNVNIGSSGDPNAKLLVELVGTVSLAGATIVKSTDFANSARAGFPGLVNNNDGIYFGMGANGTGIPAGFGFFREASGWNTALAFYTNNITSGPNSTSAMQEKMRITSAGNLLVTSGFNPTNASRLVVRGNGSYNNSFSRINATVQIISDEMSVNQWFPTLNITTVRQSLTTGNGAFGGIGFTTIDDSNDAGMHDAARIAVVNEQGSAVASPAALAFYTQVGSATQTNPATERMRIAGSGQLYHNTSYLVATAYNHYWAKSLTGISPTSAGWTDVQLQWSNVFLPTDVKKVLLTFHVTFRNNNITVNHSGFRIRATRTSDNAVTYVGNASWGFGISQCVGNQSAQNHATITQHVNLLDYDAAGNQAGLAAGSTYNMMLQVYDAYGNGSNLRLAAEADGTHQPYTPAHGSIWII